MIAPASPPSAVHLRSLRVLRGGRLALDIDQWAVPPGELVAVVGPNGSGKSTLLQVVDGLLPPARGELTVLGEKLHAATALGIRRRSALVFQDPLLVHRTVFDNVALGPRFRGHGHARVREQVTRALGAFRCSHLVNRPAQQLSGGEARRVCLARALVCDPELVMLDEPFSALDAPTRAALAQELRDFALQRGTTVVLVTHDFDDVLSFAQRAVVLLEGRIVQDAAPEVVLRRPANAEIARLVSMDNILPCVAEAHDGGLRVRLSNGVEFQIDEQPRQAEGMCCIPGDAVTIEAAPTPPPRLSMPGRVVRVVPGVGVHRVTVDCDGVRIVVRVRADEAGRLQPDQPVFVAFRPTDVHVVERDRAAS